MPTPRPHARSALITPTLAAFLALCAACGSAPENATALPPPTPPQAVAPVRHEVACIDITASVPHAFTEAALGWFAGRIATAVEGPMGEATFYARATSSRSYSPDAALATVQLPAVPPPPEEPPLPANPYEAGKRDALAAEYAAASAGWRDQLSRAQDDARARSAPVRDLALPTDATGTDVLGCELRAGELLAGAETKSLFISGDLAPNGPQQDMRPVLTGVEVTIAYWCATSALDCDGRRTAFTALLTSAGATDVRFLDPQELGVPLTDLSGGPS